MKLPSLNEYIRACRNNKYAGAKFKANINSLPKFERPVKINFTWIEGNKKRDIDNVAFAKKFILDALVKSGKLKDDNRNCVVAFTDNFEYTKEFKIVLEIEEIECEKRN